ncbi:hypothetical protein [Selenomonas noxia]|nr:hypothetical protein [Selenomonas noxia]
MEQTKHRYSFLVILSACMAFASRSMDLCLPALLDPFLAAGDAMN